MSFDLKFLKENAISTRASNLSIGNNIIFDDKLYNIVDITHIVTGRGSASYSVSLKPINDNFNYGSRVVKIQSSASIDKIDIFELQCTVLYTEFTKSGSIVHAMVQQDDNFDQFAFEESIFDNDILWLNQSDRISVGFIELSPIYAKIPSNVNAVIEYTEPGLKNATVNASYKSATLTNGKKILVPRFCEQGQEIVVCTKTAKYISKAK